VSTQITHEAAASAPKVLVAGGLATFSSDLDMIIKVLGLVYIVLQIAFLSYKWWVMRKTNKDIE
jgi:hypothetical protein